MFNQVLVNLEAEERNYSKKNSTFMCAKDGYVCFRNSTLISGNLAKKTLGGRQSPGQRKQAKPRPVRADEPGCLCVYGGAGM